MRRTFRTRDFQDLVFERAGNPALADMYRSRREMMVGAQQLPTVRRTCLGETLREHEQVSACVAAGLHQEAERAMQDHLRSTARRFGLLLE